MGGGSIDNYGSSGRRAGRSRCCCSRASPRSGVHPAQSRLSHHWHYWLHHGGHLRLCWNCVLSEPSPHVASNFVCRSDPVLCALRIIGDFTHHGRRLARSLRSHDHARSRVGDLRNALALARDHDAPFQNPGLRPSSVNSLVFGEQCSQLVVNIFPVDQHRFIRRCNHPVPVDKECVR